jgi:NRAMP (natural resistance-associated macrophage protein)-like metal ion transporter
MFQRAKQFLSFAGPGYLVAVGYVDPGNWATDLLAGSRFGYSLLSVVLLSNAMALLLQSLCVRLGVVTGQDLAQSCRKHLNPYFNLFLYALCEVAIIATDLAEVIGSSIALKLLFNVPILAGVLITAADVIVVLLGLDMKQFRHLETFIFILVALTAACMLALVSKSTIIWSDLLQGFIPKTQIITDHKMLYVAVGIIGATVMPHNLYLHSSICKLRAIECKQLPEDEENIQEPQFIAVNETTLLLSHDGYISSTHLPSHNVHITSPTSSPLSTTATLLNSDDMVAIEDSNLINLFDPHLTPTLSVESIINLTLIDTVIALFLAATVNCSILIVSSSNFYSNGLTQVAELEDAFELLTKNLGKFAGTLFATALLFAGQSSTITGTITGQIIMTGFLGLNFTMPLWIRRILTRLLAIVPAILVIIIYGEESLNTLLVFSQVILSLQLPFAVWPLVFFTHSKTIMDCRPGNKNYSNGYIMDFLSVLTAVCVTAFNVVLVGQIVSDLWS